MALRTISMLGLFSISLVLGSAISLSVAPDSLSTLDEGVTSLQCIYNIDTGDCSKTPSTSDGGNSGISLSGKGKTRDNAQDFVHGSLSDLPGIGLQVKGNEASSSSAIISPSMAEHHHPSRTPVNIVPSRTRIRRQAEKSFENDERVSFGVNKRMDINGDFTLENADNSPIGDGNTNTYNEVRPSGDNNYNTNFGDGGPGDDNISTTANIGGPGDDTIGSTYLDGGTISTTNNVENGHISTTNHVENGDGNLSADVDQSSPETNTTNNGDEDTANGMDEVANPESTGAASGRETIESDPALTTYIILASGTQIITAFPSLPTEFLTQATAFIEPTPPTAPLSTRSEPATDPNVLAGSPSDSPSSTLPGTSKVAMAVSIPLGLLVSAILFILYIRLRKRSHSQRISITDSRISAKSYTDESIERIEADTKEDMCELYGARSPRYLDGAQSKRELEASTSHVNIWTVDQEKRDVPLIVGGLRQAKALSTGQVS